MDTIRIYLENMFARLPGTPEIMKLQNDMLHTMEDKYEELKSEGKSENEAIGIVISEFGNIDELLEELGLKAAQNTEREAGANAGAVISGYGFNVSAFYNYCSAEILGRIGANTGSCSHC